MTRRAVYRLTTPWDNPWYGHFALNRLPSLLGGSYRADDFRHTPSTLNYEIPTLANVWDTPFMGGHEDVYPDNDYPCAHNVPIFSRRAVASLRPMLEPNGELLPVRSALGTFYAYNLRTIATDAFDLELSECLPRGRQLPAQIKRFVFREAVSSFVIFRIREYPNAILVNQEFVSAAVENHLTGMNFECLWPGSTSSTFLGKTPPPDHENQTLRVVIEVGQEESSHLTDGILPALRAAMQDAIKAASLQSKRYIGRVQGCQVIGDKCTFLISCPSCRAVTSVIAPVLNSFDSLTISQNQEQCAFWEFQRSVVVWLNFS